MRADFFYCDMCGRKLDQHRDRYILRYGWFDVTTETTPMYQMVDKAERENARLRELTRDYLIFYSQPGCTYCFCHDECRESEEPCMAFERLVDRTNKLGIEVDG